jgi:Protein of unknown function (DUF1615)
MKALRIETRSSRAGRTGCRGLQAALVCLALLAATHARAAETVDIRETARLVAQAEKGTADASGWAADMLDVLRAHDIPRTKENACAVIAIIDQESSFHANPVVPGLGKISEAALRRKLSGVPLLGAAVVRFLSSTPSAEDSYMSRIRAARTERDLDQVYRAMVADTASRASLGKIVNSGLLNRFIEERNEINTIGSMQVSVKFAVQAAKRRRWLPMALDDVYAVRDELYTRRGGIYYGALQLLGYDTGYDQKIYRFADYNAGRYASRNAAFQKVIATLSNEKLALDGDLLFYDGTGEPRAAVSNSEKALRKMAAALGLDGKQIRRDLLHEKDERLPQTETFKAVRRAYLERTSSDAAFAVIPDIDLKSPKIRRFMTTRLFAESVNRKYQACMKVK